MTRLIRNSPCQIPPKPISRSFRVHAHPNRNGPGFVGVYLIPGKDEQYARDEQGRITVFRSQADAVAAAGDVMCEALNGRIFKKSRKHDFERMSALDLRLALAKLDLWPGDFCWMHGAHQDRMGKWLDGTEDIPAWMRPVLAAYQVPGALDAAWAEAERATKPRQRRPAVADDLIVESGPEE